MNQNKLRIFISKELRVIAVFQCFLPRNYFSFMNYVRSDASWDKVKVQTSNVSWNRIFMTYRLWPSWSFSEYLKRFDIFVTIQVRAHDIEYYLNFFIKRICPILKDKSLKIRSYRWKVLSITEGALAGVHYHCILRILRIFINNLI